ncbi:type II secretion system protein [Halodesulfovibrio sp.]|jgi:prepilin-type N-terminal cleavage/methylation domain-containing protein|uniref:type II secretion system protein n=1 Tax=Halodesulfovibrio sp. TaxID=1912772 RepID=UPI0025CFB595|nr:type II secretion system protein [Halodesulfovibrio sp.]MCT4627886.1 type II secretion system GspH family protein [Halodesulfovibrio sp.]
MKKITLKKYELGFTMIELIAVMIVVSVLSAYAIPKFMNLTNDARFAAAKMAIASGITMAHHEVMGHMLRNGGALPTAEDLSGLTDYHDIGNYIVGFDVEDDFVIIYACEEDVPRCDYTNAIVDRTPERLAEFAIKEMTISELAGYGESDFLTDEGSNTVIEDSEDSINDDSESNSRENGNRSSRRWSIWNWINSFFSR